jgi:hypothetical protein
MMPGFTNDVFCTFLRAFYCVGRFNLFCGLKTSSLIQQFFFALNSLNGVNSQFTHLLVSVIEEQFQFVQSGFTSLATEATK